MCLTVRSARRGRIVRLPRMRRLPVGRGVRIPSCFQQIFRHAWLAVLASIADQVGLRPAVRAIPERTVWATLLFALPARRARIALRRQVWCCVGRAVRIHRRAMCQAVLVWCVQREITVFLARQVASLVEMATTV